MADDVLYCAKCRMAQPKEQPRCRKCGGVLEEWQPDPRGPLYPDDHKFSSSTGPFVIMHSIAMGIGAAFGLLVNGPKGAAIGMMAAAFVVMFVGADG